MNSTLKLIKPTVFTIKFLLSAVGIFAVTQLIFNWFHELILFEPKIKNYTDFLFVSYSSPIILLAIIPAIILISWSLSKHIFPYLKRIMITPFRFWCILHGTILGGLISGIYWYGTNTNQYQKVWIVPLDFLLVPFLVGCLFSVGKLYFQPMKRKTSNTFEEVLKRIEGVRESIVLAIQEIEQSTPLIIRQRGTANPLLPDSGGQPSKNYEKYR